VTQLRKRMLEELQRRNYSQATTRSYILAVKQFAEYFGQSPEKLGAKEIRRYQLYLLNEKKLTPGTVGIRMSALRFLYQKTLKRHDLAFDDLVLGLALASVIGNSVLFVTSHANELPEGPTKYLFAIASSRLGFAASAVALVLSPVGKGPLCLPASLASFGLVALWVIAANAY